MYILVRSFTPSSLLWHSLSLTLSLSLFNSAAALSPPCHTKNRGLSPRDKMFYPKLFRLPAKGLGNAGETEWRGGNLKMSTRSALRYISPYAADLLRFITRPRISFRNSHRRGKTEPGEHVRKHFFLFFFFSISKITYRRHTPNRAPVCQTIYVR